jgi:hypothetical protein
MTKLEFWNTGVRHCFYYLTFYINRDNWEDKPYPYAVYFTSALVGLKEPQNIGWAMTNFNFDELLSNFSWIGIFLAPFIINRFCKFMVKRAMIYHWQGEFLLLAILLSVLAIAVQISAFFVFYILLVVLLIIQKCKKEIGKYKAKTNYREIIEVANKIGGYPMNNRVLIYMEEHYLKPIGGPAGYLYNLKNELDRRKNKDIEFNKKMINMQL